MKNLKLVTKDTNITKRRESIIDILYKELSYRIIGLAMQVHSELGNGFLEKVYENALIVLFERENIKAEQQKYLELDYYGKNIGNYIADILVEDRVILELKMVDKISDIHVAQVINYLKITKKQLGIILNFKSNKLEYKRVVLENYIREKK